MLQIEQLFQPSQPILFDLLVNQIAQNLTAEETEKQYPTFRGVAAEIQSIRCASEFIISGAYQTGKTFAALWYLDSLCREFSNLQAVIVRKVRVDMYSTCLVTWKNVIAIRGGVQAYGGEHPSWFDYPNGSRVYVVGLDNPGKVLSGEPDVVYVNQAEQLTREDWETMCARATGRGGHLLDSSNLPYGIIFGDCNPGAETHWILRRKQLKLLYSYHEDNPTLFDDEGNLTTLGKRTMERLDALTGHRYLRGRKGKWCSAEGMVLEVYDPDIHLIDSFPIPSHYRRIAGLDFGFTNPGAFGAIALDGDGRAFEFLEIYQTRKDFDLWWVPRIVAACKEHNIDIVYCDPSEPAYIEKLVSHGVNAVAADNDVAPGLDCLRSRLAVQPDGKARYYIFRDALRERDPSREEEEEPCGFSEEVLGYINKKDGQGNVLEDPVKKNDHAIDKTRYALYSHDGPAVHIPLNPQIRPGINFAA
jgi:phage terminase large subunit